MPDKSSRFANYCIAGGLLITLVGFACLSTIHHRYVTRNSGGIDQGISLAPGIVETREFTLNVDAAYVIELVVNKNRAEEFDSLLIGSEKDSHGIQIDWEVEEFGRLIKSGTSKGNGGWIASDWVVGRKLGSFSAKSGHSYKVKLDVLDDGSKLDRYHPVVQVHLNYETIEGYAVSSLLGKLLGAAIAVVGLVVTAVGFIRKMQLHPVA